MPPTNATRQSPSCTVMEMGMGVEIVDTSIECCHVGAVDVNGGAKCIRTLGGTLILDGYGEYHSRDQFDNT